MKICVIMPSFLGEYPGAAKDRNIKFLRAVNSFINCKYDKKELVIVADGCPFTYNMYKKNYSGIPNIHCIQITKKPLFSGGVRQAAIDYARKNINPDIFCGLDSDDFFWPNHLSSIASQFQDNDFVYWDDYWYTGPGEKYGLHTVLLQKDSAGTSSIAWRNNPNFSWKGCTGWGHDWMFISQRLIPNSKKYSKILNTGYVVCHIKGLFEN